MQTTYIYRRTIVAVFDDLNIACINSTEGMIVIENRSIITRLTNIVRAFLAGARCHIRHFGALLRDSAAIAFTGRCKVIDRR